MAVEERHLSITGTLENVRVACDFVTEVAAEAGFGDDAIFHCNLAVEEVCTNIVEHGYQHNGAEKSINVVCKVYVTHMLIILIDEAEPFNPLTLEDPDPDTPLWEREGGGWGIYFVKQYMDDIRYQLADGRNYLILEKRR